jgi:hypothetical protein
MVNGCITQFSPIFQINCGGQFNSPSGDNFYVSLLIKLTTRIWFYTPIHNNPIKSTGVIFLFRAVAQCRVMNQQGETNLVSTTSEENCDKENTELTDIKVCSVPSLQVTLKCEEDEGDTRSTSSEICENNGPDVLSETAKDNCEITENSENKNMADTSVISREVQKTKNEQCPELSVKIDTSNEQITSLSRNTAENITTSLNRNTAENETLNKQNNSIEKSISDCEIDGQIKDFDNVFHRFFLVSTEDPHGDQYYDYLPICLHQFQRCPLIQENNCSVESKKWQHHLTFHQHHLIFQSVQ